MLASGAGGSGEEGLHVGNDVLDEQDQRLILSIRNSCQEGHTLSSDVSEHSSEEAPVPHSFSTEDEEVGEGAAVHAGGDFDEEDVELVEVL